MHELPGLVVTAVTQALENFLTSRSPVHAEPREFGAATQHLGVYRTEDYKLVRVCSLSELRVAVALSGMVMAAYALEKRLAEDPTVVLDLPSELSDLRTLQHAVAQGDSPLLIEGALDLWKAGDIPSWSESRHAWPKGTGKVSGYQGGVEGFVRLVKACWTPRLPWFDTSEHGISSVLPRTKEALKHLRTKHGIPVAHEAAILDIMGQLQKTRLLQFLEDATG